MDLGSGLKVMKYILFIFNLVFVLIGTIVLALGIWVIVDLSYGLSPVSAMSRQLDLESELKLSAYFVIAVGGIIFILCFFGCCGAIKEIRCLLGSYAVSLIVLLIIEIASICFAYAYKGKMSFFKRGLKEKIASNYQGNDGTDAFTLAINSLQFTEQCCGIISYEDFNTTDAWVQGKTKYPATCCKMADGSSFPDHVELRNPDCPTNGVDSYKDYGCFTVVKNALDDKIIAIAASSLVLFVIEIVGIVLAFRLCHALPRKSGKPVVGSSKDYLPLK